jgi:hypothetical protein
VGAFVWPHTLDWAANWQLTAVSLPSQADWEFAARFELNSNLNAGQHQPSRSVFSYGQPLKRVRSSTVATKQFCHWIDTRADNRSFFRAIAAWHNSCYLPMGG